jgi:hypothetical protein
MKLLLLTIPAAALLSVAATEYQHINVEYLPVVSHDAGTTSIQSVVRAARYEVLVRGSDWSDQLTTTGADIVDGQIIIDGTVVRWHDGIGGCWEADVPGPWAPVVVVECAS